MSNLGEVETAEVKTEDLTTAILECISGERCGDDGNGSYVYKLRPKFGLTRGYLLVDVVRLDDETVAKTALVYVSLL